MTSASSRPLANSSNAASRCRKAAYSSAKMLVAFGGAIVGVAEDRRHDADVLGVLLGDRASSGMPELMRADAPAECRLGDIPDFVRHGVRVDRLPHARNE